MATHVHNVMYETERIGKNPKSWVYAPHCRAAKPELLPNLVTICTLNVKSIRQVVGDGNHGNQDLVVHEMLKID